MLLAVGTSFLALTTSLAPPSKLAHVPTLRHDTLPSTHRHNRILLATVDDDDATTPQPPSVDETAKADNTSDASDANDAPAADTTVDADAIEVDADETSIAKEALMAEISDGVVGAKPDRAVVGEILLALEARNPTMSPATSPLLNGKWKVLYSTARSPSLKALQLLLKGASRAPKSPSGADMVDINDAYLTISAEQPRVESSLRTRVLSFENTVKLYCKLEAESAVRLVETYDSVQSEYMDLKLPFQPPTQFKRSLLVSYLDDELLVIRDTMGRPDVLQRCAADPDWAPSSVDASESTNEDVPGAS